MTRENKNSSPLNQERAVPHQQAGFFQLINEITRLTLATPNFAAALPLIAQKLGDVLQADGCYITLWDETARQAQPTAVSPALTIPPHLLRHILDQTQPLILDDVSQTPFPLPPASLPAQSLLGLPLLAHDQPLGAVLITFSHPHSFTPDEVAWSQHVADQIVLGLTKARLVEATQQRAAELEAIYQAMLSLSSSLELNTVLQRILDNTLTLMREVQSAHIFLYQDGRLTLGAAFWAGARQQKPLAKPRADGLTYAVARQAEAIIVSDIRQHPLFTDVSADWQGAIIGLPLKINQEVVGVMNISSFTPHTWRDNELRLLHMLAEQAIIAIKNAKLYQQAQQEINERKEAEKSLQQRNLELSLLNRAGQAVNATLELDQVLHIFLEEVQHLLGVIACSAWLIDPQTGELVCRQVTDPQSKVVRGWRLAPGQGIASWVTQQGQSLIVPDVRTDERHFKGVDQKTGLKIRSILTIPLQTKDKILGVIQVVDAAVNRFQLSDQRLVESLAASASIAIEHARLFTQLKDAQTRLVQRERLAALGQMAATVAHEMRNPLMGVRLGVDYLLRDIVDDDPRHRGARLIRANIKRIDRIVEDILFIARTPQPHLSLGWLHTLIEEEVARWEFTFTDKNIHCYLDLAPDLAPIHLDHNQITRVLSNLIGNSVDILLPGGEIRITLQAQNNQQIMTITDNGPGISPEHLPQVFEPFFTTKSRGTGLGLSIVKQIVDFHQGHIDVWSQTGSGTTFTVTLPQTDVTQVSGPVQEMLDADKKQ